MLSSLGAWLNIRGAWDPPAPLSVEALARAVLDLKR